MINTNLNQEGKLLVVVDVINGFVVEGALADPSIAGIVPEIKTLIEEFQAKGGRVVFIKDSYTEDCEEFKHFPAHCIKGTKESELVDELKPYETPENSYEKNEVNAMSINRFREDITEMENLKHVVVVGCCTDICIQACAESMQEYFTEFGRETEIFVPENAVTTFRGEEDDADERSAEAFASMRRCGVNVVDEYKVETDIENEWNRLYSIN